MNASEYRKQRDQARETIKLLSEENAALRRTVLQYEERYGILKPVARQEHDEPACVPGCGGFCPLTESAVFDTGK